MTSLALTNSVDGPLSPCLTTIGREQAASASHGFQRRVLYGVVLAYLLLVGVYYVAVKGEHRSAFNRWRPQLAALAEGVDIYAHYAFPTPPIMALVLYPFSLLPVKWGMSLWFAAKVVMASCAFLWLIQLIEERGRQLTIVALAVILFLGLRPIAGDLLHGNVNIWILFLLVAGWWAYARGIDWAAGWMFALAAASKVTPALFFVYFLWKREWRVLGHGAFALVVWLVVVPCLALGVERTTTLTTHWYQVMIVPYATHGIVDTEQVNQSLPALLHRLLTPCLAIEPRDGRPMISVHLASLDPTLVRRIVQGTGVGIVLSLLWMTRRRTLDRSSLVAMGEFSMVLIAMLLLSERSWKHHFVTLLPSFVVLVTLVQMHWSTAPKPAWGTLVVLAGTGFAMALTSTDLAEVCIGRDGAKYAQAYGAYTASALVLFAAHAYWLRIAERRQPSLVSINVPSP